MPRILITGFTPFDGRSENSSWIAALSLQRSLPGEELQCLQIPVIWGEPARLLTPICETGPPSIILSMGEGREGWFDVETVARNQRKQRADERGNLPPQTHSHIGGPGERKASIRGEAIVGELTQQGFPSRLSTDAGGFLCEETLFAVETLKERFEQIATALFVHLPPLDSALIYRQQQRACDESLLADFAGHLLTAVLQEHRKTVPAEAGS
jgi:pyroglutamyl-peptidase